MTDRQYWTAEQHHRAMDSMRAENDSLRDEIEHMRFQLVSVRAEVERLREALRDVAERQREACAEYLKHWTYDEHTLSRVRATPLVTEYES